MKNPLDGAEVLQQLQQADNSGGWAGEWVGGLWRWWVGGAAGRQLAAGGEQPESNLPNPCFLPLPASPFQASTSTS